MVFGLFDLGEEEIDLSVKDTIDETEAFPHEC